MVLANQRESSISRVSTRDLPSSADVVIIGAGFAGLSTAHALQRRGVSSVVLEQEAVPGFHSSGRNAAIARRLIDEPVTMRLAVRSMMMLEELPSEVPLLARTGGLLTGSSILLESLAALAGTVPELEAGLISSAELEDLVPALRGAELPGAIHVPGDGIVDIHALLMAFMRPLKDGVCLGTAVEGLEVEHQQISAVRTSRGSIRTRQVVLAGGFGANRIASSIGLAPLPFMPVRRHLFVTAPTTVVDANTPWVWDGTRGWYFRPEGAGLLLCACDETPWGEDQPMDTPVDPSMRDRLAEKFHRFVPGLDEIRPSRGWAGLRVLTPDHRFVIGADPRIAGLTWVAGLGGHGMTTACAVGELGADAVLGEPGMKELSPSRFLGPTA
jgi:glycine/D-amino acid oxidase-like deaminating enzyme